MCRNAGLYFPQTAWLSYSSLSCSSVLSHLCSSLSWDVNHRMRPAAGKKQKRIADELTTRMFWPLFCMVAHSLKFHATHQLCSHAMFSLFLNLSAKCSSWSCVYPSLFKKRNCMFWVLRQAREYVKWCQIKNWAKSRLQLSPSHFLTCNGVGGTDYIWQPKPF